VKYGPNRITSSFSKHLTRVGCSFSDRVKIIAGRATIARISARLLRFCLIAAFLSLPVTPSLADLRIAPVWYDQNAVTTTPDWHYRVPINVASGTAVNATIKVDVDFAALMATLGISGTFDVNSPRVVRSNGVLSTRQEFTDAVYAGATDMNGNGKGEVRFLLEDAGAVTYYLYFDISQNGVKPANPQVPINGNFEFGGTGTVSPPGWSAVTSAAGVDAQIRPTEIINVTPTPAAIDGVLTRATSGSPNSGGFSYLMGLRSSTNGGPASNPGVTLTRTITVPTVNPGNLVVRWRPEGWDTGDFDPIRIDLTNAGGAVLTEMVGPTAAAYGTKPFGPNTNNATATNTASGYRQYNGFDCNLLGGHTLAPPMTVACHSEPWFSVTQSLAAYAGQTINIRFRFFSDAADQSWYHVDDVEWSVVTATLGSPQGFGVNIASPAPAGSYVPGQAIPLTVQVDANPTASANPMIASIVDGGGIVLASGFILYNDGTHGDVTAGDAIWSNNNSVPAQPAPTIPLSAVNGSTYLIRVYGSDASLSSIGAQNGLLRGPGIGAATETQPNFWNIDEQLFTIAGANLSLTKTNEILSDPSNGASNPKAIPGAVIRYCILLANAGPAYATSISVADLLPPNITYAAGTMKSGAACATAITAEDDDNSGADEGDPVGASFAATLVTIVQSSLPPGGAIALTFEAVIN
jgi:uncharacterized repeat protein (TIGR01451 family)